MRYALKLCIRSNVAAALTLHMSSKLCQCVLVEGQALQADLLLLSW